MARPVLFVLAGVNGAGKSSIGGSLLERDGLAWFNPDTFARQWTAESGCTTEQANGVAWSEGLRRLDEAVAVGKSYAFETTLGGVTIAGRLRDAATTHDVEVWFCGLSNPEQHIARVRLRVERGGHDIPEARIRARFTTSRRNLIALMPHLAFLSVYDNSAEAAPGAAVPDPVRVLQIERARLPLPDARDRTALAASPEWAKPLIEAALAEPSMEADSKG